MPFDRFQICLGYYWYMAFGYVNYWEACEIHARLERIGYKPSCSDEYSEAIGYEENVIARKVLAKLVGYDVLDGEDSAVGFVDHD